MSETPYLIHEAAKAPHITGCGVLLKVQGLLVDSDGNYFSFPSHKREISSEVGIMFEKGLTSGAVHFTGIFPPCVM